MGLSLVARSVLHVSSMKHHSAPIACLALVASIATTTGCGSSSSESLGANNSTLGESDGRIQEDGYFIDSLRTGLEAMDSWDETLPGDDKICHTDELKVRVVVWFGAVTMSSINVRAVEITSYSGKLPATDALVQSFHKVKNSGTDTVRYDVNQTFTFPNKEGRRYIEGRFMFGASGDPSAALDTSASDLAGAAFCQQTIGFSFNVR